MAEVPDFSFIEKHPELKTRVQNKHKRMREEKEQEVEKRRRIGVSRTTLTTFLELLMVQPRHKTCMYIEPAREHGKIVTKSVNISVLALITCTKYKIPIEVLMSSWWRLLAQAKAIYNDVKLVEQPSAVKVQYMWARLNYGMKTRYDVNAINFLYDLYMFGRCQCSCGTVALREIMLQVDSVLDTWYIIKPGHVMLGLYYDQPKNDKRVVKIESTKNKEVEFVDPLQPETKEVYSIIDPVAIAGFNALEWMRSVRNTITWDPATKTPKTSILSDKQQLLEYAAMAQRPPIHLDNLFQYYFLKFMWVCRLWQTKAPDLVEEYDSLRTMVNFLDRDALNLKEAGDFQFDYTMVFWYYLKQMLVLIAEDLPPA